MMLATAKHGLALLQSEKPHSAVTAWIDRLCSARFEEDDYEGIPELVESINLQSTGPTEASRAIRKKLKYSDIHGQLRALTILKALVENCGQRFQATFANERLVDRIKLMAGDPMCDTQVKKKVMSVLGSWYRQFKDDPKMQLVAGLYVSCGGGKKVPTTTKTGATEAYERQQARYEQEAIERAERKARERSAKEKEKARIAKEKEDREKAKRKVGTGTRTKRPPFNFEAEKPKIMSTVGQATQMAQNLINALQHVNREQEAVTANVRVQECLEKAKAYRKTVVRYIQLVEHDTEGEYIGTLIATNEQIISAIALYDRMSKPVELDSDDEHIEQIKKSARGQGLNVPDRDDDGDTASIRSRLSAFDIQDGEVDKLQERQRARVERANRLLRVTGGVGSSAVHPDLQDLAFGSTAGSSLPPPIQPRYGDEDYTPGSLAEYSDGTDYSSSEGEEPPANRGPPPTSATTVHGAGQTNAKSYAQFIQRDDEYSGTGKRLLAEPEEGDPFADPFDDGASTFSILTPGITEKRMDWKEV